MSQPTPPTSPRTRRSAPVLGWLLFLLGVAGFAAVWVILSLFTGRQHSWMALLGALDVAWMLRLSGWPALRGPRMAAAVVGTLTVVFAANWFIAAAHMGEAFGLQPWESALRLGAHHAWTLAMLANGPMDLFWVVLALLVAAIASR